MKNAFSNVKVNNGRVPPDRSYFSYTQIRSSVSFSPLIPDRLRVEWIWSGVFGLGGKSQSGRGKGEYL